MFASLFYNQAGQQSHVQIVLDMLIIPFMNIHKPHYKELYLILFLSAYVNFNGKEWVLNGKEWVVKFRTL